MAESGFGRVEKGHHRGMELWGSVFCNIERLLWLAVRTSHMRVGKMGYTVRSGAGRLGEGARRCEPCDVKAEWLCLCCTSRSAINKSRTARRLGYVFTTDSCRGFVEG
jgi:hypothetical protein